MTLDERLDMEGRFANEILKQRKLLQDFIDLGLHVGVAEGDPKNSEVLVGMLGPFKITKHSHAYYYSVTGPTPLYIARMLYDHPLGKREIRVAGHCGCPPPEDPWVTRRAPDGRQVWSVKHNPGSKDDDKSIFSDTPVEGELQTVDSYHIDSKAALMLFTETIRRELLADPEETPELEPTIRPWGD